MKVTILGSGGSTGTPSVEHGWGACDPANPKNHRLRPSAYVQSNKTSILIDAGPDLRVQLLNNNIKHIDAIIFTHAHADHTHGISELRSLNRLMNKPIHAYMSQDCFDTLNRSFAWVFQHQPEGDFYKTALIPHIVHDSDQMTIGDIRCQFFEQSHGYSLSYGVKFDDQFVYTTDVVTMSKRAIQSYVNIPHWIVGMIGEKPHPTHAHLEMIYAWQKSIKAQNIWLTHLGLYVDHDVLCAKLPEHIRPVFDSQVISTSRVKKSF